MEGEEVNREKYLDFVRKNAGVLVMGGAGVLFLLLGFLFYLQERSKPPEMTIVTSQATASGTLKVDVGGAVLKPGVYELANGARVQDGFVAAGGLSSNADREYVSKNINLAAKLIDGAKIYIPKKGEPSYAKASEGQATTININTASESELDKLYGVGVATAQKIISGRPYSKIEDLVEKKVLGQSAFEKIKEKVTVY